MAKQTYEAGFMSFLGTKFSAEYIQSQIKAKEEKVNTLLELMESDPEMKKRFDELMMNTIGTDALITYVVNNMEDKYGMYLEPFFDKGGKPVKFGEADIDEFERIFKTLKANNGKHSS